jgi:glycosyltransferase involved in cell wall biosynthesis
MVSVVVPAFNAGRYLRAAVDSILAQSYRDFELIVIDDGSTDGSMESISAIPDERLRIVRNPQNRGLVATRNRGIQLARAPLMAILDSDDVARADRLEKQVARFRDDPALALLGSCADIIDDDGRVIGEIDPELYIHEDIKRQLLNGNRFVQSSVMVRLDAVRSVGGYPQGYDVAEDYALWLRLAETHHVANIPEQLVQYRVHGAQISQRKVQRIRIATDQARGAAWQRLVTGGSSGGVEAPKFATRWQRLCGKRHTLGEDLLYWAQIYRAGDKHKACIATVLRGLRAAPLSGRLWAVLVPTKLNLFYWYYRLVGSRLRATR